MTVNPTGTTANLVSLSDAQGNRIPVLAGTQITITFDNLDLLTGSAGCNTYSTSYKVNGTRWPSDNRSPLGGWCAPHRQGSWSRKVYDLHSGLLSQVNSFSLWGARCA